MVHAYYIFSVKVFNADYKSYRMKMVTISVSHSNAANGKRICATFDNMENLIEKFDCVEVLQGRYVTISMGPFSSANDHKLQVAEMQVFGWE